MHGFPVSSMDPHGCVHGCVHCGERAMREEEPAAVHAYTYMHRRIRTHIDTRICIHTYRHAHRRTTRGGSRGGLTNRGGGGRWRGSFEANARPPRSSSPVWVRVWVRVRGEGEGEGEEQQP